MFNSVAQGGKRYPQAGNVGYSARPPFLQGSLQMTLYTSAIMWVTVRSPGDLSVAAAKKTMHFSAEHLRH